MTDFRKTVETDVDPRLVPQHSFDVIGLSETKIKSNCDLTSNIAIEGYDFVSKPTLTNAGGVGFFIKGGIQFHIRDELCSTTKEFESLWIEIYRTYI